MGKRTYIIPLLLVVFIAVSAQAYAWTYQDVVGIYSVKYEAKFWIQGEGTLKDTNYGTIKIKGDKTFVATENDDGKTKKYKGECKVKDDKFIVLKTNSLRTQIWNKAIEPWLISYVEDKGGRITNISKTYSKYKITKADISADGPDNVKIIIHGIVRGNVTDMGRVSREFRYVTKVIFQDRIE